MSATVYSKTVKMCWRIIIWNDFLEMKRVAAQLVPKDLNFVQKLDGVKAKNSTNIIEQPPYSPDKAPADFFLFPELKLPHREK